MGVFEDAEAASKMTLEHENTINPTLSVENIQKIHYYQIILRYQRLAIHLMDGMKILISQAQA